MKLHTSTAEDAGSGTSSIQKLPPIMLTLIENSTIVQMQVHYYTWHVELHSHGCVSMLRVLIVVIYMCVIIFVMETNFDSLWDKL